MFSYHQRCCSCVIFFLIPNMRWAIFIYRQLPNSLMQKQNETNNSTARVRAVPEDIHDRVCTGQVTIFWLATLISRCSNKLRWSLLYRIKVLYLLLLAPQTKMFWMRIVVENAEMSWRVISFAVQHVLNKSIEDVDYNSLPILVGKAVGYIRGVPTTTNSKNHPTQAARGRDILQGRRQRWLRPRYKQLYKMKYGWLKLGCMGNK